MAGIDTVSAVLGIPAFAGALVEGVAKSYALVKHYEEAEPRARHLLNEIQLTSDLVAHLQLRFSDRESLRSMTPALRNSLSAWLGRSQTTQRDIERRFSSIGRSALKKREKLKLAAANDCLGSLESRVSGDRIALNSLLGSLQWYYSRH